MLILSEVAMAKDLEGTKRLMRALVRMKPKK
jgi:hypothetical protein